MEDVGGRRGQKAILETIELPLRSPHLFASGLRQRSGVLLHGPPGTGKTLLAKAVATECRLSFLSVKGPELISPYVGESERQLRELFARAREAAPCVVFFDEIDALSRAAAQRATRRVSWIRIVSQLMAEIDGVNRQAAGGGRAMLFVLGATNRPDLLDESLLRPGRFDRLVRVTPPETREQQVLVLRALTRKFDLAPGVDLAALAERLPAELSGAELYALCAAALTRAIQETAREVDARKAGGGGSGGGGAKGGAKGGAAVGGGAKGKAATGDVEAAQPAARTLRVRKEHFEEARQELFPRHQPDAGSGENGNVGEVD